ARHRPARTERAAGLAVDRLGHRYSDGAGRIRAPSGRVRKPHQDFRRGAQSRRSGWQLLASEGFGSIEELAMVDEKEIAGIEGFDADTAKELQERAKEYLDKQEAELDAKRVELGVADELKDVPGVSTRVLVALGENGVKTVED